MYMLNGVIHVFLCIYLFILRNIDNFTCVFEKIDAYFLGRAISSAGRASRLHRDGRQFKSVIAHHDIYYYGFIIIIFMNLDYLEMMFRKLQSKEFLSLLLAAILFFAIGSSEAMAMKDNSKVFGDWSVICPKKKSKDSRCVMQQRVEMPVADKSAEGSTEASKRRKVSIAMTEFFFNKEKQLVLVQTINVPVLLQEGVKIISGDKTIVHSQYYLGGPSKSTMIINPATIKKLRNAKPDLQISFVTHQQDGSFAVFNIPFSRKGFSKALKYIK